MTRDQYQAMELMVIQLITQHITGRLPLDKMSKEVFTFALMLAENAYQKLDDALREPEE